MRRNYNFMKVSDFFIYTLTWLSEFNTHYVYDSGIIK